MESYTCGIAVSPAFALGGLHLPKVIGEQGVSGLIMGLSLLSHLFANSLEFHPFSCLYIILLGLHSTFLEIIFNVSLVIAV